MKLLRVGIVGSRSRCSLTDKDLIRQVLISQLKKGRKLHLVSGGCRQGADKFAENLAEELGLGMSIHKVDLSDLDREIPKWVYAERAYARNGKIVDEADILVVTHDGISGGTADTITKAKKKGIPIIFL